MRSEMDGISNSPPLPSAGLGRKPLPPILPPANARVQLTKEVAKEQTPMVTAKPEGDISQKTRPGTKRSSPIGDRSSNDSRGAPPSKRQRKSPSPSASSSLRDISSSGENNSETTGVANKAANDEVVDKDSAPGSEQKPLGWYDTLRLLWPLLQKEQPDREYFNLQEICKGVEKHWSKVRDEPPPSNGRWRTPLCRVARNRGMLEVVRSANGELLVDSFTMRDPNYQPRYYRSRNTRRPNSQAQKPTGGNDVGSTKDQPPQSGSNTRRRRALTGSDDEEAAGDELTFKAVVPREFAEEAVKPVRISELDKAKLITFIGKPVDNVITGHKGYRMARATTGVSEGDWFFEVDVLQYVGGGAVRLGWCMRRSDVETPVGFDAYGFAIRDRSGELVNRARRTEYGSSFGPGDVIGCRIQLPFLTKGQKETVAASDRRWLEHRFVKHLLGTAPGDSGIDIFSEACVSFYKNGVSMGTPKFFSDPFENKDGGDISGQGIEEPREINGTAAGHTMKQEGLIREMKAGVYFPAIALFGKATVKINFGPNFMFGLPKDSAAMCDAAPDAPVTSETTAAVENVVVQPQLRTPGYVGTGRNVAGGGFAAGVEVEEILDKGSGRDEGSDDELESEDDSDGGGSRDSDADVMELDNEQAGSVDSLAAENGKGLGDGLYGNKMYDEGEDEFNKR